MKKLLLVLILVCLMVFGTITTAFGATLYLDTMVGGGYSGTWGSATQYTGNATMTVLGINYPINQYQVSFEYGDGKVSADDSDADNKFTYYELKGGYSLYKDDKSQCYATLSLFNQTEKRAGYSNQLSGFLLGGEYSYNFSEQISLEGLLGYSISTSADTSAPASLTDLNLFNYKLKFGYKFSDDLGAALSYCSYSNDYNLASIKCKNISSSFTLGMTYSF